MTEKWSMDSRSFKRLFLVLRVLFYDVTILSAFMSPLQGTKPDGEWATTNSMVTIPSAEI